MLAIIAGTVHVALAGEAAEAGAAIAGPKVEKRSLKDSLRPAPSKRLFTACLPSDGPAFIVVQPVDHHIPRN